ncbi:MAG: SPOR domain-containing protein [Rubrivivax sp.]|nr:SPOR domain-containing protein [Rubrivivax sp.]
MMDDLRLAAVAARVVAWHNRHPLARRIGVAHVHAVGYVGLPFVGAVGVAAPTPASATVPAAVAGDGDGEPIDLGALEAGTAEAALPEGGSLRERAQARARQQAAAPGLPAAPADSPAHALAVAPVDDAPPPALATLQPDFSEDFIDPLRPRAVARFAARAGQVRPRPPDDGPLRQVTPDGAHPGRLPARVYLLTAVIETDTRKSRVLLGTGLAAPVLGQRIFSGARMAVLAALSALVLGLPAWLLMPASPGPALLAALPAEAAASAAALPPAASGAGDAPMPVAAIASPPATSEPSGAETSHAAASVPVIVASAGQTAGQTAGIAPGPLPAASAGVPPLPHAVAERATGAPSIRPVISEADKALARQARQAARPEERAAAAAGLPAAPAPTGAQATSPQASAPKTTAAPATAARAPAPLQQNAAGAPAAPATVPATAALPSPPAPATAASVPVGAAFALSTRALRTRAEAEQVQVAMRSLLRTLGATSVKVDVLPQGDDWRVVGFPFPRRADADQARALLVSRGMRVEVVGF